MKISTHQTTLSAVFDDMRAGRLVRPGALRPCGWSIADVVAFWRSIRLGIPLGSVTAWRPPTADMSRYPDTGRLGPAEMVAAPGAGLLLDGYARLASVAWTLRRPAAPVPDMEDLDVLELAHWTGREACFDLPTGDLTLDRIHRASDGDTMPAHLVADTRGMLAWQHRGGPGGGPIADDRRDMADRLQAAFRTSSLIVHTIESGDVKAVVDAMVAMERPSGVAKGYAVLLGAWDPSSTRHGDLGEIGTTN